MRILFEKVGFIFVLLRPKGFMVTAQKLANSFPLKKIKRPWCTFILDTVNSSLYSAFKFQNSFEIWRKKYIFVCGALKPLEFTVFPLYLYPKLNSKLPMTYAHYFKSLTDKDYFN